MSLIETMRTPEVREHMSDEDFVRYSLDALADSLARKQTPSYPAQHERLVLNDIPYYQQGTIALSSDGPWCAGQVLPTHEQKINEVLGMLGYPMRCTLDGDYRPLHPWWREMVRRSDIGGVVGRGFYYRWGANFTADAAVVSEDSLGAKKILLIQRGDTGDWALPGGFIDDGEKSYYAALRELQEETGVHLGDEIPAKLLYSGPVADIRTTLHAWADTSLWKFSLTGDILPEVAGGDDAQNAEWFDATNLPLNLYGSHAVLIAKVLED